MGRVRHEGTEAELRVRRILHGLGARYRVNVHSLPGSPDIANKTRRKAIFVHGCFWHHHVGCPKAGLPKVNREFWRKKFADNRARDERKEEALRSRGIDTLVVWECELNNEEALSKRLRRFWFD